MNGSSLLVYEIDEKPVRLNVTLAVVLPWAGKLVVSIGFRQCLRNTKLADDTL
jgi:hypothetical protein